MRPRTDHGQFTVTDWTWNECGYGQATDWSRTGRGHGLTTDVDTDWTWTLRRTVVRILPAKPRRIRGQLSLENSRGEASTLQFTQIV